MKKSLKICLYIAIGFAAILILSLVYKSLLKHTIQEITNLNHRIDYALNVHEYNKNPCDFTGDDILVFKRIVAIGDSMTSGVYNSTEDGSVYHRDSLYSYPYYLSKLTGCRIDNWGKGGATTKEWWEYFKDRSWDGYDCALIQLGINDGLKNDSANTYQYLDLIIKKLQHDNNGISIFISTISPTYSTQMPHVSDIIREFSRNIDGKCFLVDMERFGHTYDVTEFTAGHLTAIGYLQLAKDWKSYVSSIIHDNPMDFRNIQFTGKDEQIYK